MFTKAIFYFLLALSGIFASTDEFLSDVGPESMIANSAEETETTGFLLPLEADVNKTVWMHGFNMQSHVMENWVHLARTTRRTLVEPYFHIGVRNWTWFEHHNAKVGYDGILNGILGFETKRFSEYFDPITIGTALGRKMVSYNSFQTQVDGRLIDAYVRFIRPNVSEIEEDDICHPNNTAKRDSFQFTHLDTTWKAKNVICLDEWSSLSNLQNLLLNSTFKTVAVHYIPMKYVEWRHTDWKNSTERFFVRDYFQWSSRLVSKATDFIQNTFGDEDYIAVHWRRGDRAYRAEMLMDGFVDTVLSSVDAVINYIQSLQHHRSIPRVFVATNSGNENDLEYLLDALSASLLPPPSPSSPTFRSDTIDAAIIEQIICSKASLFVTPPGLGMPTLLNATSNFSTWVVEQRDIDGRSGTAHYEMCCGSSFPVVGSFYPLLDSKFEYGQPVYFMSYGAFVPFGGHGELYFRELAFSVPLNESGFLTIYNLPAGRHTADTILTDAEGTRNAEMTSSTYFTIEEKKDKSSDSDRPIIVVEENRDYLGVPPVSSQTFIPAASQSGQNMSECLRLCEIDESCIAFTHYSNNTQFAPEGRGGEGGCWHLKGEFETLGEGLLVKGIYSGYKAQRTKVVGRWTRCMPLYHICLMSV